VSKAESDASRNAELTHLAIEAWNRGDVETLVGLADPDIELNPVVNMSVSGQPYRGHEGVRRFVRDYQEAFEDFELSSGEVREIGDRVVWIGKVRVRGRDSGVELDQPFAIVSVLRDRKTLRFRSFLDPAEALKCAQNGAG
jgi:uncharacterized protein